MSGPSADRVKLPRQSKGKRSQFYDDPAIDQVMTLMLELMAEMSAMRERVDTVERLLDERGVVSRQDIETYKPSPAVEAERTTWVQAFTQRVLRVHNRP